MITKVTALFFTPFLLCYLLLLAHATRPEPAFHQVSSAKAQHEGVDEAVDESCGGIEEEECLIRRTLAAHIDYIYTQKKHNP